MASTPDRIEKEVLLEAKRARVWKALTDSREFGSWFGMRVDGPFRPGATMRGIIVPTVADAEVAKRQKPFEGAPVEIVIDRIEPETLFSFRWHPAALPGVDVSSEPMTLVTFTLEDRDGGTLLRVVESGFGNIPLARRADAFEKNEGGWTMQTMLIAKYLASHAA